MRYPSKFSILLFCLIILVFGFGSLWAQSSRITKVTVGQSQVVDFSRNIKRLAVANPDVADATVTTPSQALVTGKQLGTTNLYVWNEAEQYERIRVMVIQEPSNYQVSLQVKFFEVNRNGLLEFGSDILVKNISIGDEIANVGSYAGKVSSPNDPLLLGSLVDAFITVPTSNVAAIFKALQEKNLATLLAAPNLTARDTTEASFLAGGEFPIPIVSGSAGMQSITIQFKEYGIKLKFVPTVLSDEVVCLKLESEVSSLDFENGIILSGFRIPALDSRKANTTVELRVGEYLVIGGLLSTELKKNLSRIPVLGHIPVLGKLFSSIRYWNEETELLITVCPNMITSSKSEPVIKLPEK